MEFPAKMAFILAEHLPSHGAPATLVHRFARARRQPEISRLSILYMVDELSKSESNSGKYDIQSPTAYNRRFNRVC